MVYTINDYEGVHPSAPERGSRSPQDSFSSGRGRDSSEHQYSTEISQKYAKTCSTSRQKGTKAVERAM